MISDLYELQQQKVKSPEEPEKVIHSPYEMPIVIGALTFAALIILGKVLKRK